MVELEEVTFRHIIFWALLREVFNLFFPEKNKIIYIILMRREDYKKKMKKILIWIKNTLSLGPCSSFNYWGVACSSGCIKQIVLWIKRKENYMKGCAKPTSFARYMCFSCGWWEMFSQLFFFFFNNAGVRASLRAPRLVPRPTEHPASPSEQVRHHGDDRDIIRGGPRNRKGATFQPPLLLGLESKFEGRKIAPNTIKPRPVGMFSQL